MQSGLSQSDVALVQHFGRKLAEQQKTIEVTEKQESSPKADTVTTFQVKSITSEDSSANSFQP